ncbi:MAG TPA: DUF1844 domain-containing protein [Planctomycetes bacterium]|nr:DUF1844 domain-containing protein [Planctomycetota bacterium]
MSDEQQIPEASFLTVVYTLATQAMIALGEIPNPMTGKTAMDPRQARWHIDSLLIIRDKTRGNLTEEEEQGLANALSQVQLTYVEKTRNTATPVPDAETTPDDDGSEEANE